jgi:hypothetical protein
MSGKGAKGNAERQARYRQRMRESGAVEVQGWVSSEDADEARAMLERLGRKVKPRSAHESVVDQD